MSKVIQAAGAVLKVRTWSPSRLAKWKECPAKVKYEDLLKICPACFKGRVSGGFDGEPVKCDTCSDPQPEREALDRGNMLDIAISQAVVGAKVPATVDYSLNKSEAEQPLAASLRHPKIHALARKLAKTKGVLVQESIVLDSSWKRVSQFTKNAWARLKLDVLYFSRHAAKVIDWKSGNIDKSKMEIRERSEYHDSMRAYQVAVLAAYPSATQAEAIMAFLDAPPRLESPFKALPVLSRRDFEGAKRALEQKIEPMMNDTVFAPRPGYYCSWCPFSKRKGGPCPH
jgi:uncharacterized protein (DUF983 family)